MAVSNESGLPAAPGDALPDDPSYAPSGDAVVRVCEQALRALDVEAAELSVLLVDDTRIRDLNATWRGKDAPTNVLSFPQDGPTAGEVRTLGDVVVSLETVARQGNETGSGYAYTFAFYLVHGVLHLLGWDHETPEDDAAMMAKTREILETAGL